MGVLYEHWRTDLNECFYVGASWENPDSRPYEMHNRNDDHLAVQEELAAKGLKAEVRLIECEHLSKEDLGELEILQIAYWKDLIGKRLTNKAKGGWNKFAFEWTDEMRQYNSDYMKEFYATEDGAERKKLISKVFTESYNKLILEIGVDGYGELVSERLLRYFQTEKGIAQAQKHSETIGPILKDFYQSPEGIALREKMSEERAGENHPMAKISEETAQKILDFDGYYKDAAKKYGVSDIVAWSIRRRKSWMHLTPTNGINEIDFDWSKKSKNQWDNMSDEKRNQHSESVKKALAALPEGLLSQKAIEWQSSRTFEERSSSAKKAAEKVSTETRSNNAKDWQSKKTPEQRSAATSKGWETRRAKAALKQQVP